MHGFYFKSGNEVKVSFLEEEVFLGSLSKNWVFYLEILVSSLEGELVHQGFEFLVSFKLKITCSSPGAAKRWRRSKNT